MTLPDGDEWFHAAYVDAALRLLGVPTLQAAYVGRDGRLRTMCQNLILDFGTDLEERLGPMTLDPIFWRAFIADPQGSAEWQSADFGFHDADGQPTKVYGVHVSKADFFDAFPLARAPFENLLGTLQVSRPEPVQTAPVENRGAKPNKANWTRFAVSLAIWVHQRNDEAADMAAVGPDQLLAELDQIAMDQLGGGIARSTFQDAARAFNDAMRKLAGK